MTLTQSRKSYELRDYQVRETLKYGHEFRGTMNQERLCWREPAEIYLFICLSSKRRPHFQIDKRSHNKHKLGHGSRWDSKPRTIVLARTNSNLLDWTGMDSISKPRITVLTWASNNLAVSQSVRSLKIILKCLDCINLAQNTID
jgi:hypothetical protein